MAATTARRDHVEPLPGAETTFAALRAAGVRVCLVTDVPRAMLDHVVDVLGWRDLVDLAVAPDHEEALRGAPYPDLILASALRVRVDDIRDVAVVANTVDDLVAGRRAGASIVAAVVGSGDDEASLRAAPHTHVLRAIDEFPVILASAGSGAPDGRDYSSSGGR
jgi:phosphoglycolate phosphatase-like HAD superfamily hydrolase